MVVSTIIQANGGILAVFTRISRGFLSIWYLTHCALKTTWAGAGLDSTGWCKTWEPAVSQIHQQGKSRPKIISKRHSYDISVKSNGKDCYQPLKDKTGTKHKVLTHLKGFALPDHLSYHQHCTWLVFPFHLALSYSLFCTLSFPRSPSWSASVPCTVLPSCLFIPTSEASLLICWAVCQ